MGRGKFPRDVAFSYQLYYGAFRVNSPPSPLCRALTGLDKEGGFLIDFYALKVIKKHTVTLRATSRPCALQPVGGSLWGVVKPFVITIWFEKCF